MDIWVSGLGTIMNRASVISFILVLCSYSFFLCKYLEVELLSHRIGVCLTWREGTRLPSELVVVLSTF